VWFAAEGKRQYSCADLRFLLNRWGARLYVQGDIVSWLCIYIAYLASHGTITVGGIDLQMIPLETLRSNLAIVSQDSVLFEGDIRFNLCVSPGL
jgi:hypothetical protein